MMMIPTISLALSLLTLTSTLATKSSDDQDGQNIMSPAYALPILLRLRTVSSDFSAPHGRRPSFFDQKSRPRKNLCAETSILQGSTADAKHGENIDSIVKCNADGELKNRMTRHSSIASDGSTVSKEGLLKRFRPRRNLLHHGHAYPSSIKVTDSNMSTDSEKVGYGASESSAGKDVKMRQRRPKRELVFRQIGGQMKEKKPMRRDNSFDNLNPWSRHLFHFHGLRQKTPGREGRRSRGVLPSWRKRAWEDIDMPAWGKRLAVDDDKDDGKASRNIESLTEPLDLAPFESLSYDNNDNFGNIQSDELAKEKVGWEKRDWEDIDMHAWGKREKARDRFDN